MKTLASWLSSWATTLRIRFFERGTWRVLTQEGFGEDDFTETGPPVAEPLYLVTLYTMSDEEIWVPHVTRPELIRFTEAWKSAGSIEKITLSGENSECTLYARDIIQITPVRESEQK